MQDPRKTGAFISRLRKAQNWTQLELADRLNVTHQAVSRWETGSSFPDIGTLVQIAQLFGVQVDDVLNGEEGPRVADGQQATLGEVLTELAQDHPEQVAYMVQEGRVAVESVIAAGPLTTPTTMDRLISALEDFPFNRQQLQDLAPFLSQEILQRLLLRSEADAPRPELIVQLAPFLGEELLQQLVNQIVDGTLDRQYLRPLAPFLSRETRAGLLPPGASSAEVREHLSIFGPFLDRDEHEALVTQVIDGTLDHEIALQLAPFLNQETLLRLIEADPLGEKRLLARLAPFLSQETIAHVLLASSVGKQTTRLN